MLTSDQLDVLTDPIIDLYERYMQSVIDDIARRLAGLDYARPTAAWQMQRLTESGKLFEKALEELAQITGKSESTLRAMFERAGVKALRFDDRIYRAAGLNPLPLNLSPAMAQVLAAGLEKTNGLVRNLTMTSAAQGQNAFIEAAHLAYMQISNGAFDYIGAIRGAVKRVAASGLGVVNYASGRVDQLDVALRRAVLTGVNQTVGRMQWARADEMGQDLVQTSAHAGARNTGTGPANHEGWQGRIFSRSGAAKDYPNFIDATGYGTGVGLMGWNCRHSYFPFFEGISENAYSEEDLAGYERKTVSYQGKEIGFYEATQEQRAIERKIRYWKRQEGALKAAGLDASQETAKVKTWQARMRAFTRDTGLMRQPEREWVPKKVSSSGAPRIQHVSNPTNTPPPPPASTPGTSPKPTPPANLASELDKHERAIYPNNFETAVLLDPSGNVIFSKPGASSSVSFSPAEASLFNGNVLTHNHPLGWGYPAGHPLHDGSSFSPADIQVAALNNLAEIRAVSVRYIHTMRPGPNGWPPISILQNEQIRAEFDVTLELMKKINNGVLTPDEANAMHWHLVSERVANYFGLLYNRYEHHF